MLLLLCVQVLKSFLTARQGYILQCVSELLSDGDEKDLDTLAVVLADVAGMVRGHGLTVYGTSSCCLRVASSHLCHEQRSAT